MNYSSKLKMLGGALALLVVGLGGSSAFAQVAAPFTASSSCQSRDSKCFPNYAVTYYSSNTAGQPDQKIRVVDTGLVGDPLSPDGNANICVNFYVFDANQELSACCSCLDTADGLLVASVQNQLTNNPLTGKIPSVGVIKMTATFPMKDGSGNFTQCSPTSYGILPSDEVMAAFASHLQMNSGTAQFTETNVINRPLSWNEFDSLRSECQFAGILGSGQGACTCPVEK